MKSVIQLSRLFLAGMLMPLMSFAEEAGHAAAGGPASPWIAPAIGFAMGVGVFGAASAQGKIAAAFMDGASRNPSAVDVMRTPLILSLIFAETLVLFAVLIALMLVGKI